MILVGRFGSSFIPPEDVEDEEKGEKLVVEVVVEGVEEEAVLSKESVDTEDSVLSSAPNAVSTEEEEEEDYAVQAVQAAEDERVRATVAATQARNDRMEASAIQTNDTSWWATPEGQQLMFTYNHSSLERVHLKLVESSAFTDLFNPNLPELSAAGVHASTDLIRFVARTDELPAVLHRSGTFGFTRPPVEVEVGG